MRSPGDRHALLHAAGELMRQRVLEAAEPDLADIGIGDGIAVPPVKAARLQAERNIVANVHPGKDAGFLEHHRVERPRRRGAAGGRGLVRVADHLDRPGGSADEPRQDAQQRRLAAAARADDAEELARPDVEVERGERVDAAAAHEEVLLDTAQPDFRAAVRPGRASLGFAHAGHAPGCRRGP
jgi:hypothetical protein